MEIDILIEEGLEWSLEESWLRRLVEQVLITQGAAFNIELGLVIVGQEKIRELNLTYLGKDEPTDVLAFSMLPKEGEGVFVLPPDGIQHLGEIAISYPQAVIQAEEHHHSIKKEIAILIIHGVLHILGYDHNKPELERQMKTREAKILSYVEGEIDSTS